jgi:spermidine synthase
MKSTLLLFTGTLFLSALLLFFLEPIAGKMLLPFLGGVPAVWNTCMVFFQLDLLAAYAYAYAASRFLSIRNQMLLQALLLGAGLLILPIDLRGAATPAVSEGPIWWLAGVLASKIGLPFFALSATAPLLQRWFSRTDHPAAKDPYFLYAASNLGSLAALLGYPSVVEPVLGLSGQSRFWAMGYAVLVLCSVGCGWIVVRSATAPAATPARPGKIPSASWRERLHWLALAAVPSSLLLGVTTYISTDVAAVPLLWVIPLALYLLSFVITFARRLAPNPHWMLKLQVYLLILISLPYVDQTAGWYRFLINLAGFFVIALVCHGELARRRPPTEKLTEFYLFVSLGGAVGGILNALVAPAIFSAVYEYPIMLALSCLLRRPASGAWKFAPSDLLWPLGLSAMLAIWLNTGFGAGFAQNHADLGVRLAFIAVCIVSSLALLSANGRPLALSLGLAALLLLPSLLNRETVSLAQERNFFGVLRVRLEDHGRVVTLVHGNITHGAAFTDPVRRLEPLTYYNAQGPAGQVFASMPDNALRRIGVVGLGTGALSCYRRPGQTWTFYEIDPAVETFARDRRFFHFLSDCGAGIPVVLGDGRLSIQRAADGEFDLLILDAYSSDAIPVHLLTREALTLYLRKTAPGGLVLLHISSRYFNLLPVVAATAQDVGARGLYQDYSPPHQDTQEWENLPSLWVALAKREEAFSFLMADGRWQPLTADPAVRLWADDYSNVFSTIRWH